MGKIIDLTGKRFGKLVVIERLKEKRGSRIVWRCKCDCGNVAVVSGHNLRMNITKSCGCIQRDIATKRATKHGLCGTRLYNIWSGIIHRCDNPNASGYANYGGRGISICQEWRDPTVFCKWAITNGYQDDLSIDRIDVNGDYCPNNCRWANRTTQNRNQRQRRDHAEYTGVRKQKNKYVARIGFDGKGHYLGIYDTAEEASKAYEKAKQDRDRGLG